MTEDWSSVAADVADALAEVGTTATLSRTSGGPTTPWDTGAPTTTTYSITVVEDGVKTRYARNPQGALVPRTVRVLTIGATGEAPRMGDTITLGGVEHEIAAVMPLQPGGTALLYEAEIAI